MNRRTTHERIAKLVGPRGRVIAQTGAWSSVAKACGAANLFLSIPFVLQALGPVQFGAWATLVSFIGLVGFLDFGFGNGTMNLIAAARGRNEPAEIATIINEGMRALWKISGWLAIGASIALIAIPWHSLLGLPAAQSGASREAAAAVLTTILLAIPLNLAARVQLGLGRGDRAFQWQALGQLLTLCATVTSARAGAPLPALTAIAIGTPLLSAVANTIDLRRSYLGNMKCLDRNPTVAQRIRHEGGLFFVLQLAGTLAFASDLPLISALRGPTDAGTYAIVQRLFSIVPLGLSLLWVPLWPAYRQALASGDHAWVVRTLRSTIILTVCSATIGGAVLFLGFAPITQLWIGHHMVVGYWMLGGFAVWYVIDSAGTGLATFLNAASIFRFQVIVATAFAIVCLVGKILAIKSLGSQAVPWTTSVTYVCTVLIPVLVFLPKFISHALHRKY